MTPTGHVLVCGLRDVSLRIVEQLHLAHERVVVVTDDPDPRTTRLLAQWEIELVEGSPRRAATLQQAGLAGADALLCVDDDDLANLEVALLARRLRPDLRVVLALTNAAVGRAVTRVTGPGTVLDVAGLAAPAFVEAALQRTEHHFALGEEDFAVVEIGSHAAGPLRALVGDLAPVAVIPADGGELVVCPGRDHVVAPADRVFVVGARDDLAGRRQLPDAQPRRRERRRARVAWQYVTSFARETERSLRLTLLSLLGVAAVSVLILFTGYRAPHGGMSPLDATYFTTETLTTVGFGDFTFANQPSWLRIWAIALMIIGATLVTVVYALLTNLLVSRRIEESLGRQHVVGMSGHLIVVGLGSVGMRVVELLVADGQQVVVLERDENNRYLGNARALDIPVIIGDSTLPANLAAANLASASGVAVLTSNDLANIETGLAVDDLLGDRRAEVPVVLRVFDRQLAHTIEATFNFRYVRSTSALAAPWFVGAALGLDVRNTFYVEGQLFLVGSLSVTATGGLVGRTMQELSARIRVVAIRRGAGPRLEYPPRRDTRFGAGDEAFLLGPYEELLAVLRQEKRAAGAS